MALLNNDNKYIKVEQDGHYTIYASEIDRDKEKNSTPFETIIAKYTEIVNALLADEERQYYDTANWSKEFNDWDAECNRYAYNHQIHKVGEEYPLMKEIYQDVENSIVNIIEEGSICQHTDTPEEMYQLAKERKYWGETGDC